MNLSPSILFQRTKRRACRGLLRIFDRRMQRRYEPYLAHFRHVVGYQPSILLPTLYNEKMLWRKLIDHSPLIATFCDKLATKEYISRRVPSLHIPETLWTGTDLNLVPRELLESKAMIKCNHGCDYNFAWNPAVSDFDQANHLTREWMTSTYGTTNYEWGYTQVPRRIFLEQFIETNHKDGLIDIAVRAANGRPLLGSITTLNKMPDETMDYFDCDGRHLVFGSPNPGFGTKHDGRVGQLLQPDVLQPTLYNEAVNAAAELSRGFDYGRFDFLSDGRTLYAGEITVYPASGLTPSTPEGSTGTDPLLNPFWSLRNSGLLTMPQRGWRRPYAFLLRTAL